jgi:tetratricopeptide (TPR) repeat protein
MVVNDSLKVSGCDDSKIVSNEIYVSVFLCAICKRLVSLDSVVSGCCSQPFCNLCFEEFKVECSRQQQPCYCPLCHTHPQSASTNEAKHCESTRFEVRSLQKSQPLAFKVLSSIQIACAGNSCTWIGRYNDFFEHLNVHHGREKGVAGKNDMLNQKFLNGQCGTGRHGASEEADFDEKQVDDLESNIVRNQYEQASPYKKAEKVKKRANAKFNSGSILDAHRLYTEAISLMKDTAPRSDSDFKLHSNIYANRAATLYQLKKFDECIEDCEFAIGFEPKLEKSWIRKWRALMAKGAFHDSLTFLRQASLEVPESIRIQQELAQSEDEMDIYIRFKELFDANNMASAEAVLRDCIQSSENILLLTNYAKVTLSGGDSELSRRIVERALEINPHYDDCLELLGLCHFFSGDGEQAAYVLAAACNNNTGNIKLKATLERVEKTQNLYGRARFAIQQCRYDEADHLLTTAIQVCEPVPPKSMLFSKLRTDRANCLLHRLQYLPALNECNDVIEVQREYAPIWVVRSEVLMALGKVDEATRELRHLRHTWGAEDSAIEFAYNRADFERRVLKVDAALLKFQNDLDNGTCDMLPIANTLELSSSRTGCTRQEKRGSLWTKVSTKVHDGTFHTLTNHEVDESSKLHEPFKRGRRRDNRRWIHREEGIGSQNCLEKEDDLEKATSTERQDCSRDGYKRQSFRLRRSQSGITKAKSDDSWGLRKNSSDI